MPLQHGCVFNSVTVLFIPLWKLSFLRMYLKLHTVLLRISFHVQILHILYVYNYCVVCSLQWTAVTDSVVPYKSEYKCL
jgi:hypothetical protein